MCAKQLSLSCDIPEISFLLSHSLNDVRIVEFAYSFEIIFYAIYALKFSIAICFRSKNWGAVLLSLLLAY